MHIADLYIGLPFRKGGRARDGLDCYGLVRLFWQEQIGLTLPRYDQADNVLETIAQGARDFMRVPLAAGRLFDAVLINIPVALRSGRWASAPVHFGVIVAPGLVLHIEEGMTSRVDPLDKLNVFEVIRVQA
jgi:hypothetical protein